MKYINKIKRWWWYKQNGIVVVSLEFKGWKKGEPSAQAWQYRPTKEIFEIDWENRKIKIKNK